MASRDVLYDQVMSFLERYAAAEIKRRDEGTDVILNSLQHDMSYYCNSMARYNALEKVFAAVLDEIQQAKSTEEAEKLCKKFDELAEETKNIQGASNSRYTELLRLCTGDEIDEEIQVESSSRNVIDPISKQRMVDPVKNSMCGHSYERSVVLQLIKKNPRTRCPIGGCSATHYIEAKHLKPDEELKAYLANCKESHKIDNENSRLVSLDDTV